MANNNKEIIIELDGITKKYFTSKHKPFTALNNINLKIARGERIGIVGKNGSGKTTLLKIIGGSIKPSQGEIHANASIVSLIDLEAGFEPELTGFENIMVNGLIIGMKKQEIKKKLRSIINFADIGAYINEPFYTYSAGMKFRLACAVAINSKAEVLLFDEILISGDWDFQKKIFATLAKTLKDERLTTITCSHVPELLWSLADKYYLIEKGVIKKIYKNQIRRMLLTRHKQFHRTFKTNQIEEFGVDQKNKRSS